MKTRAVFGTLSAVALAVCLAFLTIPVLAVFTDSSPATILEAVSRPESLDALALSFRTSLIAIAIVVIVGTPAAYLLATRRWRPKPILTTLIELPLVLPPAAAGIALLAAFGPGGILGGSLDSAGVRLVFETAGVVVALAYISAPFFLRQAQAAFEATSPNLVEAARTLGRSEVHAFLHVSIPTAAGGLSAGLALALGRALGEFGATLMFAGSIRGITETAPLAIYSLYGTDFPAALGLSAILIVISFALLLTVKLFGGRIVPETAGNR